MLSKHGIVQSGAYLTILLLDIFQHGALTELYFKVKSNNFFINRFTRISYRVQ